MNQEEPQAQLERTVYISPGEVGWLLDGAGGAGADKEAEAAMRKALHGLSEQIDCAVRSSLEVGIPLALPRLADLFGLSEFELQAVVICLAPELRAKYDRLYAYLQDDITRKRPSVDLVLDLLCETEDERWNNLEVFSDSSALLRRGLLQTVEDPHSPSGSSGLAQFLRVDPRIRQFLLGDPAMDARLAGLARLEAPASATASERRADRRNSGRPSGSIRCCRGSAGRSSTCGDPLASAEPPWRCACAPARNCPCSSSIARHCWNLLLSSSGS